MQEIHPVKKIPHSEVQKTTLENKRRFEAEELNASEMRECQLKPLAKRADIAAFLKTFKAVQSKRQLSLNKILEGEKRYFIFFCW